MRRSRRSTSFTSIPPELADRMRSLASQRGWRKWQVYDDALKHLMLALAEGRAPAWEASIKPAGSPFSIYLPEETVLAVRQMSDAHRVRRSTVLLTAVRFYLSSEDAQTG